MAGTLTLPVGLVGIVRVHGRREHDRAEEAAQQRQPDEDGQAHHADLQRDLGACVVERSEDGDLGGLCLKRPRPLGDRLLRTSAEGSPKPSDAVR